MRIQATIGFRDSRICNRCVECTSRSCTDWCGLYNENIHYSIASCIQDHPYCIRDDPVIANKIKAAVMNDLKTFPLMWIVEYLSRQPHRFVAKIFPGQICHVCITPKSTKQGISSSVPGPAKVIIIEEDK